MIVLRRLVTGPEIVKAFPCSSLYLTNNRERLRRVVRFDSTKLVKGILQNLRNLYSRLRIANR